jgi:cellulose synthase/poly-beta-1,6-N-acetylglucosamine synthase-like glycosyltransferase
MHCFHFIKKQLTQIKNKLDIFFQILFWLSVSALFHSYVFFPFLLKIRAKYKVLDSDVYTVNDELPFVSILMSLYNEEEVISDKIKSIYNTSYPINKFEIKIGSDHSTDNTNQILRELQTQYKNMEFVEFPIRHGKQNVINTLYENTKGEILILTDANVMFEKNTIFELIKYFKNNDIGLTDSRMINTQESINKNGISLQESTYISREVRIKQNESSLRGLMMGPFGGCFAIRKELFEKVPDNFLVDDFFINMTVLAKGKKAINNIKAIVYEDVSNNIKEEFRRKVRISAGNFQNLIKFFGLLFSNIKSLSYYFISHKVIRWIGPFIMILILILNIFLFEIDFYKYILYLFLITGLIPLLDLIFSTLKINISFFRFFTHFYVMNLALLIGFYKFMFGIKSGIWQPTGRNQTNK